MKLDADAIVNAANDGLWRGGGICGAIHAASGVLLEDACKQIGTPPVRCPTGQTVITEGFRLPARYVLHTVGPTSPNRAMLCSSYKTTLDLAVEHGLRSVGLCCVSTGIFGFPLKQATHIALDTARQWLDDNPSKLQRIVFVMFKAEEMNVYRRILPCYFPRHGDPQLSAGLAPARSVPGPRNESQLHPSLGASCNGFVPVRSDHCSTHRLDSNTNAPPEAVTVSGMKSRSIGEHFGEDFAHGLSSHGASAWPMSAKVSGPRVRMVSKKASLDAEGGSPSARVKAWCSAQSVLGAASPTSPKYAAVLPPSAQVSNEVALVMAGKASQTLVEASNATHSVASVSPTTSALVSPPPVSLLNAWESPEAITDMVGSKERSL